MKNSSKNNYSEKNSKQFKKNSNLNFYSKNENSSKKNENPKNNNTVISQIKFSSQEKEKASVENNELSNKTKINSFSELISICNKKKEIGLKSIKEIKKENKENEFKNLKKSELYEKATNLFPDLEIVDINYLKDKDND